MVLFSVVSCLFYIENEEKREREWRDRRGRCPDTVDETKKKEVAVLITNTQTHTHDDSLGWGGIKFVFHLGKLNETIQCELVLISSHKGSLQPAA